LGVLVWPYVHAQWSPAQRAAAIAHHHHLVDRACPWMALVPGERRVVADLSHVQTDLHLVLDRPNWFQREGELVLNLELEGERLFSVAWLLEGEPGAVVATIGAVQGSSAEGVTDRYRDLTKALCGLRPRDFLLDALRLWCTVAGVHQLRAVDDASRHHRHPFFGADTQRPLPTDYDALWLEQQGERAPGGYFNLPMDADVRDLELVPSKKRSMYRKRQALLDALRADMVARGEAAFARSPQVLDAALPQAATSAGLASAPAALRRWAARVTVLGGCTAADAVFAWTRLV
jgi:uncharacterized protein VirK/YbjX